jgi:hypothetical protein
MYGMSHEWAWDFTRDKYAVFSCCCCPLLCCLAGYATMDYYTKCKWGQHHNDELLPTKDFAMGAWSGLQAVVAAAVLY